MWKSMSARICRGLPRGSFWMPSIATPSVASSSGVARSAAREDAAGSMISRISNRQWMNSSLGFWSTCQRRTSGSSMFQSDIGRMRVPIFGRETVRPFAERRRIASRTAVRETPNSSWMRGSVGSVSPGRYWPDTMRLPIVPATVSDRLPRASRTGMPRVLSDGNRLRHHRRRGMGRLPPPILLEPADVAGRNCHTLYHSTFAARAGISSAIGEVGTNSNWRAKTRALPTRGSSDRPTFLQENVLEPPSFIVHLLPAGHRQRAKRGARVPLTASIPKPSFGRQAGQ